MFHLNDPERKVVIGLAVLIFFGICLEGLFHRSPALNQALTFIDRSVSYSKVDLNRATAQELEALPFIGEFTAQRIIEYRRKHRRFRFVDELRTIKGIRPDNFSRFRDYLEVRP